METVKLNKKKKIVLWKRIVIAIVLLATLFGIGLLGANLRTGYKYYKIDTDRNTIQLGLSDNKNLKDDVVYKYLKELEDKGYIVADYNLDTIIDRNFVITWKSHKNNDENIEKNIENAITAKVYAYKLTIGDNTYYLPEQTAYSIIEQLGLEKKELEGDFIEMKKVLNGEQLENFISENKTD